MGKFVKILEDPWKCWKGPIISNVYQNKGMCRPAKFSFKANEINGFGGLNLFSLIILNEVTIKCVTMLGRFMRI
jgi:hypothetical protein